MKFFNTDSDFTIPPTWQTLKWMLGWHNEKRIKTPSTGVAIPFEQNDGHLLRQAQRDTLTWIGQASFLLQLSGKNILIDPVMSDNLGFYKRNSPPGLSWEALPPVIDAVFITHNHRDHMDADTLKRLGPKVLYVVPKGLGQWFISHHLTNVIELRWWEEIELGPINITFVPAQHWSRRSLTDINTSWWGGYIFSCNGIKLYHSGDTGWFEGFKTIAALFPDIDVVMLPVGAYAPHWFMHEQHMDPQESVDYFRLLGAKHFVGMHWGTFKLSDEPIDEARYLLPQIWEHSGLNHQFLHTGILGQTLDLQKMLSK